MAQQEDNHFKSCKDKKSELTPVQKIRCLCSQDEDQNGRQPRPRSVPEDLGSVQQADICLSISKAKEPNSPPKLKIRCLCSLEKHTDEGQTKPGINWDPAKTVNISQTDQTPPDFANPEAAYNSLNNFRNSAVTGTIVIPIFCIRCRAVIENPRPTQTPRSSLGEEALCPKCELELAEEKKKNSYIQATEEEKKKGNLQATEEENKKGDLQPEKGKKRFECALPLETELKVPQHVVTPKEMENLSYNPKTTCYSCQRSACRNDCNARTGILTFLSDEGGPSTCKRSGLLCKICMCVSCNDLCRKYGIRKSEMAIYQRPKSSQTLMENVSVRPNSAPQNRKVESEAPKNISNAQPLSSSGAQPVGEEMQSTSEFIRNTQPPSEDDTICKECRLKRQICKKLAAMMAQQRPELMVTVKETEPTRPNTAPQYGIVKDYTPRKTKSLEPLDHTREDRAKLVQNSFMAQTTMDKAKSSSGFIGDKRPPPDDANTCKECQMDRQACKELAAKVGYQMPQLKTAKEDGPTRSNTTLKNGGVRDDTQKETTSSPTRQESAKAFPYNSGAQSVGEQCKMRCPLAKQDKACEVDMVQNLPYQPEVCNRCGLFKRRPRKKRSENCGNICGKCKKKVPPKIIAEGCDETTCGKIEVPKKDCEHCCGMDKPPVHTPAAPSRSATKSELKMALNALQNKIRSKDALINTLKEELRLHANQDTTNKLIADQKYVPFDYDRFNIAEELQPQPKLRSNKYGRPIQPCPCDKCGTCDGCACPVNPSPLKILYVKRLSHNLLVRWVPSESNKVIGYEVCIGGVTKSRLFDRESEMAVIGFVEFSKDLVVSVYALCDNGRCLPGATSNFPSGPENSFGG